MTINLNEAKQIERLIGLGMRFAGFERRFMDEMRGQGLRNEAWWEYSWDPKKFARNTVLLLTALWAKDGIPNIVNTVDGITSPSEIRAKTTLEDRLNWGIRLTNFVGLVSTFSPVPKPEHLLAALNDQKIEGERGNDFLPYFFAPRYSGTEADQVVRLMTFFNFKNLGPLQINGDEELYVVASSAAVPRYRVIGTDVTRISGEVAREYLIVQPLVDDALNLSAPVRSGNFRVRVLGAARWDEAKGDVDWGNGELNKAWNELPTSDFGSSGRLSDILEKIGMQGSSIPMIFPGVQPQITWRDRITQLIQANKPFHQLENIQPPLFFIPQFPTSGSPKSKILQGGVYKGRPGSFANTGLPRSVILDRQKTGF